MAQAVVVNHFTIEEPRHRLQAYVRVRGHIHRLPVAERQGTEAMRKHHGPIIRRSLIGSALEIASDPRLNSRFG